ncbi:hypothetical protein JMUB7504_27010 [Staphylococcus aureus]
MSHPGCDNTQQRVAQMCHDGLDLNQRQCMGFSEGKNHVY